VSDSIPGSGSLHMSASCLASLQALAVCFRASTVRALRTGA